ncbi:MAG: hypothetical protein WCR56_04205 [Bacilli bacterium]
MILNTKDKDNLLNSVTIPKDTKIGLTPEQKNHLMSSIDSLLKTDPLNAKKINDCLETDKTYDNSLGNIYFFLDDNLYCKNCKGQLSLCPKKAKGYYLVPEYDKYRDMILLSNQPCKLKKEEIKFLNSISPTYLNPKTIVDQSLDLYKKVTDFTSFAVKYHDTVDGVRRIGSKVLGFKEKDYNQGLVFYSINSKDISKRLLMMTAFLFAKTGKQVSYLIFSDLVKGLSNRIYNLSLPYQNDFYKALNVPVLILEGIDDLPRYGLTNSFRTEYLMTLFRKRNQKGLITFASVNEKRDLENLNYTLFSGLDCQAESKKIFASLFDSYINKDLPF